LTQEQKLIAFDWLATDFDAGGLDNFMRARSSSSAQEASAAVTNTLGCMAEIGTSVATMGTSLERNVVTAEGSSESSESSESSAVQATQEDGELERETGSYTSCIALLVQVAEAVAGSRQWSASDAWRVKGAVQMQRGALDETKALLADLPFSVSQSTLMAVKQVLCVLTLYKAYFEAKDGMEITITEPVKGTKETYVAGTHRRTLELARVKQGTFMASVTAYRKNEQIELVQVMLGELEKLYTVLTQAIQREGMRLNIRTEKMLEELMAKMTTSTKDAS